MDNNTTEIMVVIDRSGSMGGRIVEVIEGFNTFLKEQQDLQAPENQPKVNNPKVRPLVVEGREVNNRALMTLVLFDHEYTQVHFRKDIMQVPQLTTQTYQPRGSTGLYDAIARTIHSIRDEHEKLGDGRPARVLLAVITDGMENCSKEFNKELVTQLIKDVEDNRDWQVLFLAENLDAAQYGANFGINQMHAASIGSGAGDMLRGFATISEVTRNYRQADDQDLCAYSFGDTLQSVYNGVDTNE